MTPVAATSVCPGAGARKDRCRPEDVIELDLDHEFEPGLPLELYMHSEVHRLKPQIGSLIHVHSPSLVALAASASGDEAIALLRWHGAIIVGATLHEAVFRAILAEEHAAQLVTALPRPAARAGARDREPRRALREGALAPHPRHALGLGEHVRRPRRRIQGRRCALTGTNRIIRWSATWP